MVFKLAGTFANPVQGANAQRGFPAPGTGAQTTGPGQRGQGAVAWSPLVPIKGKRSWGMGPSNPVGDQQRGFPAPLSKGQQRPGGRMPNQPIAYGLANPVRGPVWDHGAADWVQNFGKVLSNPIGAGIAVNYRPQSSYGGAAQYVNGALWWSSQTIPTSIPTQSLTDPATLAALLGTVNVQAVVRTTG
jgi:hypothetical protein